MWLSTLLANPDLGVSAVARPTGGDVRITWVTSNELIDPTPFVDAGTLLVVTGIGLNVRDQRTWDAYVERLVQTSVAALGFRVGVTHGGVPDQLVSSCRRLGLPLLQLGVEVPFSTVEQFVLDRVRVERARAQDTSWRLAERLAASVTAGAGVRHLLEVVGGALQARVALLDGGGAVLAQWPEDGLDPAGGERVGELDTQQALVPVTGMAAHSLVVVRRGTGLGRTPLAPVASILALHLERLLNADEAHQGSWMAELEEQLSSWDAPGHAIARTFASAGVPLCAGAPRVAIALGPLDRGTAHETFSLRLQLGEVFDDVWVCARRRSTFLLLRPADEERVERAVQVLTRRRPDAPLVLSTPVDDPEELRVQYLAARARLRTAQGPWRAPAFDLLGLVTGGAGRASRHAARRFFAPVLDHDSRHRSQLMATLRTYLRCDARPGATAAELHVHRNTLAHRLGRIEALLGTSLSSLTGLTTCVTAFELLDHGTDPDGWGP